MSPVTTRYLPEIEAALRRNVAGFLPTADVLYGMMRYFLGWQDEQGRSVDDPRARGKRFRPTLTLLVCEAIAGAYKDALPFAAAIELFHNFTLIHDDIEDYDEYRRHKKTVWKVWGIEQAINAGDGMATLAHRAALDTRHPRRIEILQVLTDAWLKILEGQHVDLSFEARGDVAVAEYFAMIEAKTAVLVAAAAQVGAMVATDKKRMIDTYRDFGLNVGLAYQVFDDIDSIWTSSKETGKARGGDIRKQKKTLPFLYALSKLPVASQQTLQKMYRKTSVTDAEVRAVTRLLDAVQAKEYCTRIGNQYRAKALQALTKTGVNGPRQDELKTLAQTIVG